MGQWSVCVDREVPRHVHVQCCSLRPDLQMAFTNSQAFWWVYDWVRGVIDNPSRLCFLFKPELASDPEKDNGCLMNTRSPITPFFLLVLFS